MSIAVGVPMFSRDKALRQFLYSVPQHVDTVYVADNGRNQRRDVYSKYFAFDLEVLHLEYDCGIGNCRRAIVDACDEDYLWLGDNDMEFTRRDDLHVLKGILERNDGLGGVAGWLIEDNVVRAGARNIQEHGSTAIKSVAELPEMEGKVPFARFDFIPQAALFRTECFDDYSYDPEVQASEHFDFFYGQQETDWEFASTPAVMIQHHKQINKEYRESDRGSGHIDLKITKEKWGIEDIVPGSRADWGYARGKSLSEQAFELFRRATPPSVWIPAKKTLEKVVQ